MERILRQCLSLILSLLSLVAAAQTVKVNVADIRQHITPLLYGACIEDVNHECYGGIYDQKIYGESFEETSAIQGLVGFSKYEGIWPVKDNVIGSSACNGGKVVYDELTVGDGVFKCEMLFDNQRGSHDGSGILFRVSDEAIGAEKLKGYAFAISNLGTYVKLFKYDNNRKTLATAEVNFDPMAWNEAKVELKGNNIKIYLNAELVIDFTDEDNPFLEGKLGLVNLVSDIYYKKLSFRDGSVKHDFNFDPPQARDVSYQWKALETGDVKAKYRHEDRNAFHGKYCQFFRHRGGKGRVGLSNMGLNGWGIPVYEGDCMSGYIWLKGKWMRDAVYVALESEDGAVCYDKVELGKLSRKWTKYEFKFKPSKTDAKARFVLYTENKGRVWADMAMLLADPSRQYKGLPLRQDVAQFMKNQGLKILRYGGTMINVPDYRFKNMIGPRDQRPPYRGHWSWWATNGFGIEDFVLLCNACGFTSAFAVNVAEDPKDVGDMVEYLNGDASTEWGSVRAANGHPEPYGVKYVAVGNEEVIVHESGDAYQEYIDTFNKFYDEMKARDPEINVVCAMWWRPNMEEDMERVFHAVDGKAAFWDFHPWADELDTGVNVDRDLTKMEELFHKWNPETKMRCIIFEENGLTHNMKRTLGHVTLQNAVRRHGDFVEACCAANALQPYLQNDNSWDQGQVFLTPTQVWGMPPYYAQQMASANHMPLLVSTENSTTLDITATTNEASDRLVLHVANTGAEAVTTTVDVKSFGAVGKAESLTLAGDGLYDYNPVDNPMKVVPKLRILPKSAVQKYSFPPYSYTILSFSK